MKIGIFPGQGSQHLGMGSELFGIFKGEVDKANQILGFDVVETCLTRHDQRLNQTQFTQPLLFLVCALTYIHQQKKFDAFLGHSLGLYPALFAASVIDLEQGLSIVKKRAELMTTAQNGSMMAVLGNRVSELETILVSLGYSDVDVANDNTETQRVLSGKKERLVSLKPMLSDWELHAVLLPVSGAFHSRYMKDASRAFFEFLVKETFQPPSKPVFSTTDGAIISTTYLLEELAFQLVNPVRYCQTIKYIQGKYPDVSFEEIGPGKVLSKLNQQILNQPVASL